MARDASKVSRIFRTAQVKPALVISTFGAVPYVHLALESWRWHCPSIPALVCDDASRVGGRLRALCRRYGAEFSTSPRRLGRDLGDLSACVRGLEWAAARGVELLVKMSRRFVPLHNWVPQLQRLAFRTQYATFSRSCGHFGYGFRTECFGLHVESWRELENWESIRARILELRLSRQAEFFVEPFLHGLAKSLHRHACRANREFARKNPPPAGCEAYGHWTIMPAKRVRHKHGVLWHDADGPGAYLGAARTFGLEYTLQDFARLEED